MRSEYPSYIYGLPMSFLKDNSKAEGNYMSIRAWRFGLWRFIETAGISAAAIFAASTTSTDWEDILVDVLFFVGVPLLVYFIVHTILMCLRRSVQADNSLRMFEQVCKNEMKDGKPPASGCLLCGIACCGYKKPHEY